MKLKSVSVRGFRGYKDEQVLNLNNLTTLIGKNDVGKSTLLEALEIFFNNSLVKIDASDLNVASEDKLVEIACTFTEFPASLILDAQAATSLADEYLLLQSGELRIKKVWNFNGARLKEEVFVTAAHPSADKASDLLTLTNTQLKARYRELDLEDPDVSLSINPSIRKAIWASFDDLALSEADIPVSTTEVKKIWEKLSTHLPLYALFQSDRASRDSDAEVQDPMKLAVSAALADASVQELLAKVNEAVRVKATELAERTHGALTKLDAELAKQLVPKFKAEQKWGGLYSISLDGDDGIPINKRGSGVRRLVLVSFFRAEAERKLADGSKQNIIYAIEEPETSQHPRNQRLLLESLRTLATTDGCQVLLTSHSPGFASFLDVEDLRFVTRSAGKPEIQSGTEAVWEAIAEDLGVVPDNRVKALVCVEGPTDVEALRCLSAALHAKDASVIDLSSDPRIAFVVLGGGTLSHWVNKHYLSGLNRPEMHIYDSDVTKYQTQIDIVNARTDGSWGLLTSKLEIENYLHTDAIKEGLGVSITFTDQDDVPGLIRAQTGWKANTVKKKLSQDAFPRMTAERISAVDNTNEIKGWLKKIEETIAAL